MKKEQLLKGEVRVCALLSSLIEAIKFYSFSVGFYYLCDFFKFLGNNFPLLKYQADLISKNHFEWIYLVRAQEKTLG
tara:strand:- start:37099 stop:37329 length:231 start_codon:yes stop_codon:yes gene_type:complete